MAKKNPNDDNAVDNSAADADNSAKAEKTGTKKPVEVGGPPGPEPTRYGDWERKGICVDF